MLASALFANKFSKDISNIAANSVCGTPNFVPHLQRVVCLQIFLNRQNSEWSDPMHKMLMSAVVAAALIQGCTTVSDSVNSSAVTKKHSVGYVASDNEYVRVTDGNCLRSIGWSSDNMVVECQASAKAPAAEPKVARLSYNGKALFEFDSAQLSAKGRQELDRLVAKMNTHRGIGEVNVVGHADSVGEATYNQSLSERRAATVRGYLKSELSGVRVSAVGMGESAPVADNATAAGRQKNRRVEVNVDAKVAQ